MQHRKNAPDKDSIVVEPGEGPRALPFYPQLPEDFLDPKLLIRLSHARCLQWQCLPICEDAAGVTIATHSKTSIEVLTEQMSRFFDKRIHWVLCPEKYLQAAIHRAFGFYQR